MLSCSRGPGALTAEKGTIGNEDDIVVRQIRRLLVRVLRLVGQLPQSRAVDVHFVQVRHLLDRPYALAEVTAKVVLLRQLQVGTRAAVLRCKGEDETVSVPVQFQPANMSRAQPAIQKWLGRILRRETVLNIDVAAWRVCVPTPHGDIATAARRLSQCKNDPIEVDVRIGKHNVPQRQPQFEVESAPRAKIGG